MLVEMDQWLVIPSEFIIINLGLDLGRRSRFSLVGFYGISTIVGYLMPYPLHTYMLNIYDL